MKLSPIIQQIKDNVKKGLDIENSLYMLMMNAVIYTLSDFDVKYITFPNKNYKQNCIKFLEEVKKQPSNIDIQSIYQRMNFDLTGDDCFENSDEEKQNFFNKEQTIIQKGRKPTAYEDSLIQSLLNHLNEKEELLKKRFNNKKQHPENFKDYLDQMSPYELWKIIQDLKGGYYFFEVFENQKPEYGINYSYIDKMMMCSKSFEREYNQFKTHLRQQQELHYQTLKQEMNKLGPIELNTISEPICLIIKEDPEIECNCNQRGARQALRQWSYMNQIIKLFKANSDQEIQQYNYKGYFRNLIFNLEQYTNQVNQQFDYLIKINEILKSKVASLRILHQQLIQESQNLTKAQRLQDEEIIRLKQQLQKLQLEKSQINTRLINTENSLLKIREFSDQNNIINKTRLVAESLEQLEFENNQAIKMYKIQQMCQLTQTENSFEYQLCTICRGENAIFQNIQQLKIPQITFEKLEMKQIEKTENSQLQNKFTQTEFKLPLNVIKNDQIRYLPSPGIQRKRGASTSYHLANENSILLRQMSKSPPKQIINPVFKRLFEDSLNKKVRQSQLSSRIQGEEKNQWEEMLMLLNKLNNDQNNKDIQKKIEKSIESYKDQFDVKDKLPQIKLKDRPKVSEHLIDTLMKELQDNKKVALQELVDQFQSILTVNKLNKSRDMYNKITI
ncbi:unnamed protein product [Paramecium primaurelia]|uniref:Uncharacterized protein n=1 Tax=Paramecium primaurelia TaxID=5886 RepID=A0A8S1KN18_PARPR|nr:unnamed protein product [Paramecium primaurelia]